MDRSSVTEVGKRLPGVFAAIDLPSGTKSTTFLYTLVSAACLQEADKDNTGGFTVKLSNTDELIPVLESKDRRRLFWPQEVTLASDCQNQNLKMTLSPAGILVQTTKHVRAGEELFLWFSDDILCDLLRIPPYLSPACIRGGNCYTCTICGEEFEAPNPLKIHISLKCKNSKEDIWYRLGKNFKMSEDRFRKSPSCNQIPTSDHPGGQVYPLALIRTDSFNGLSSYNVGTSLLKPIGESPPNLRKFSSSKPSPGLPTDGTNSEKLAAEHHSQLESIVSNMGKAKNGHVCLYCGKLYSRKYGLKIHIRTHTGFKPLKCKICQRPFGDPSNLNKHVRLHSDGNTPYRCNICSKVLVRRRDLDRHIRSRHSSQLNILRIARHRSTVTQRELTVNNRSSSTITSSSL